MKKIIAKIALWCVDQFVAWIDKDKDGILEMDEIVEAAKELDKRTREIVKKLKKK